MLKNFARIAMSVVAIRKNTASEPPFTIPDWRAGRFGNSRSLLAAAFLAAAAVSASCTPSLAAQPDVCASQTIRDLIVKGLAGVRDTDGRRVSSYATVVLAGTPRTITATPTKLICQIRVTVSFGGESRTVRGRVTYELFPGGKASAQLDLSY